MTAHQTGEGEAGHGSRARSLVVASAAVATIIGTSWYSLRQAGIDPFRRPGPTPAAGVPIVGTRSLLRVVSPAGDAAGEVAVLMAAEEEPRPGDPFVIQGLLARELARQALLIAARDELGLTTRDATLGEVAPGPEPGEAAGIELRSLFGRMGTHTITLLSGEAPLLEEEFEAPVRQEIDCGVLAEMMARLSREGFPTALRRAGVAGSPIPWRPGASVPEGVEQRLGRLAIPEQFAAVRTLHEAIRADGTSGERLGALVRGYAHLGVLSEDLWTPAHKAYKARALLYAHRLVAREPDSARALWHRAYALALSGLHRDALADLAAAADRADAGDRPAWVDLIDAYCRFDTPRLAGVPAADRDAPLARLLAFLALEGSTTRSWGTMGQLPGTDLIVEAARDALELDPACDRIHRASCRYGGVAHLHRATVLGPAAYAESLPGLLRDLPGLPDDARALVDDPADEPALMRALVAADDPGAISWAALGHLLREARFLQAHDRLWFVRNMWSVPADPEADAWRPLVADHPYRDVIEAAVAGRGTPQAAELLPAVPYRELELSASRLFMAAKDVDPEWGMRLHDRAFDRADWVAWDQAMLLQDVSQDGRIQSAIDLFAISPQSPLAIAVLIDEGSELVASRLEEFERSHGHHPAVLLAIGRRHAAQGRLDDAGRVLARCLERSGDLESYEALAAIHRARGDLDAWRETLDRFLRDEEDLGLDHARVRVRIAQLLMSRGEYQAARPYAEAAARSWAEWAMRCAVACYDGLGDASRAELWARRLSERYPSCWAEWFLWCKRTGLGDLDAARRLADRIADAQPDRFVAGCYHALAGRPERAVEHFRARFDAEPNPFHAAGLILTADEAGDAGLRDATLAALCDGPELSDSHTARLCRPLRAALLADPPAPLDLGAIDAAIDAAEAEYPGSRGTYEFVVGRLLRRHGRPLEGLAYLRRCAEADSTYLWWRVAALCELRAAGADPVVATTSPRARRR